jgi:hypothetical protein
MKKMDVKKKRFYHSMVNERKAEINEVITSVANNEHIPALIHYHC